MFSTACSGDCAFCAPPTSEGPGQPPATKCALRRGRNSTIRQALLCCSWRTTRALLSAGFPPTPPPRSPSRLLVYGGSRNTPCRCAARSRFGQHALVQQPVRRSRSQVSAEPLIDVGGSAQSCQCVVSGLSRLQPPVHAGPHSGAAVSFTPFPGAGSFRPSTSFIAVMHPRPLAAAPARADPA